MREIDLQALIQSIEAEQRDIESLRKTIEADGKTRQEAAEKVARAWEADRKARQEAAEKSKKIVEIAAEESRRGWDNLREFQIQSTQRMERSIEESISKAVNQVAGLFTTQWGLLVEPGCVEQFRKIGMDISRTMQRIEHPDSDGRQMERKLSQWKSRQS